MRPTLGQTVMVTVTFDQACVVPATAASESALIEGYQRSRSPAIWAVMEARYGHWREACAVHLAKKFHLPRSEWWDVKQETALAIPDAMLAYKAGPWCEPEDFSRVLAMKIHNRFVEYMRRQHRTPADLNFGLWIDLLDDQYEPIRELIAIERRQHLDAAVAGLPALEERLYQCLAAGWTQRAFAVEIHISTTGVYVLKCKMFDHLRQLYDGD